MEPTQEAANRLIKVFTADHDTIEFIDERGDGHHFLLKVVSDVFKGRSQIERQRIIYDSVSDLIQSNAIHALRMELKTHAEAGDLNDETQTAQQTQTDTDHPLYALITKKPIMVFMKGDRFLPQCGFSAQIIDILDQYGNIIYETFDILEDEDVRQDLKEYSQWPTYPQLYINGQLIGGLDITKEMHEKGELEKILDQVKKDAY